LSGSTGAAALDGDSGGRASVAGGELEDGGFGSEGWTSRTGAVVGSAGEEAVAAISGSAAAAGGVREGAGAGSGSATGFAGFAGAVGVGSLAGAGAGSVSTGSVAVT
jgi:hypothetical protein